MRTRTAWSAWSAWTSVVAFLAIVVVSCTKTQEQLDHPNNSKITYEDCKVICKGHKVVAFNPHGYWMTGLPHNYPCWCGEPLNNTQPSNNSTCP